MRDRLMRKTPPQASPQRAGQRGLTLIEVMMTILIFGTVLIVVNEVFQSSNSLYTQTATRAGQQMTARTSMALFVNELRSAGCDPTEAGIGGLMRATEDSLHFQFDLDGDGVITTNEPSEDVLYYYDANTQILYRNPGTGGQALLNNVSGVEYTFFDENNDALGPLPLTTAQLEQVRAIGFSVTTYTQRGGEVESTTRIALRNTF